VNEDEIGRECSMHWEKRTPLVGKPERSKKTRRRLENMLERILEKQGGVLRTGFIWLKIGTSGGLL
jgi:hypothetical protein